MTDSVLAPILSSPKMVNYLDELNRIREEEQRRRTRFWDEVREDVKAEFVNGEVLMHSPARLAHIEATRRLSALLSAHVGGRKLGVVTSEKALVSLTRNDYEPDVCFFGVAKAKGLHPGTMRFPAPDLVVEVLSDSTAQVDRGIKMDDYAAHGVDEYWLVDADAETVEQYLLRGEAYELAVKVRDGVICSRAVPGFSLSARAVFGDEANLEALRAILAQQ